MYKYFDVIENFIYVYMGYDFFIVFRVIFSIQMLSCYNFYKISCHSIIILNWFSHFKYNLTKYNMENKYIIIYFRYLEMNELYTYSTSGFPCCHTDGIRTVKLQYEYFVDKWRSNMQNVYSFVSMLAISC